MAESRQLSVRLSEATFAKLEAIKPSGVTLAEVARKVIERQLGTSAELPLLGGGGGGSRVVTAEVKMGPFLEAIGVLQERLDQAEEMQRETLRAVQEQAAWTRERLTPKGDAEMDRKAANAGEQAVRAWERSMGR